MRVMSDITAMSYHVDDGKTKTCGPVDAVTIAECWGLCYRKAEMESIIRSEPGTGDRYTLGSAQT